MSKEDRKKSPTQTIEEYFARITDGMDEAEKLAVMRGYKSGMEAKITDLRTLELKFPHLGDVLLSGIETGLRDNNVQMLLAKHRGEGDAPQWLEEQISISIQQMVDIASGRRPSVSNPRARRLDA